MGADPLRNPQYLGYVPAGPPGLVTLPLDGAGASAVYLAFGLLPWAAKTLTRVRVFLSAVAGTLGANDLTCDVYSGAPGQPNASLGSAALGSAPSGAGWVEFTGLSVALTAGTQYWLVFKNANASPGTNNATYRFVVSATAAPLAGVNTGGKNSGNAVMKSVNAGGSWSNVNVGAAGCRVGYGDGSYEGLPASNVVVGSDLAFGSSEVGVKLTSPANAVLNVAGVAFMAEAVGAPAGQLRFRLYGGTTLLGTTNNLACAVAGGSGLWYASYFAADVVVQPSTVLRATFCDSAADGSSNCFKAANEVQVDADANSLPLLPFEGTLQKSVLSGGSWTDTATSILPFALILDSAGEFGPQGGVGVAVYPQAASAAWSSPAPTVGTGQQAARVPIEVALTELLTSNPAVAKYRASVGPWKTQQAAAPPCVSYEKIEASTLKHLSGLVGLANPKFAVRCYAATAADAKALADGMRGNQTAPALDGFRGRAAGCFVQCCRLLDVADNFAPPVHGDDAGFPCVTLTFQLWYEDTGL